MPNSNVAAHRLAPLVAKVRAGPADPPRRGRPEPPSDSERHGRLPLVVPASVAALVVSVGVVWLELASLGRYVRSSFVGVVAAQAPPRYSPSRGSSSTSS